jgi:hypothetical protein
MHLGGSILAINWQSVFAFVKNPGGKWPRVNYYGLDISFVLSKGNKFKPVIHLPENE